MYRSVLRYLARSKKVFALFMLALLFELSFEYFTSLSIKYLIDDAIAPRNVTVFVVLLSTLLIGGLLNLAIGVGGDYLMSKLNETILIGLRRDLYDKIQKLSAHFYSRYRVGDIVARFTIDIPAVEHANLQTLSILIVSALSMLVGTALLFLLNWQLALIAVVGIAFMFLPQKLLNKRAQRYNEEYVGVVESFSNNMDEEMKTYKLIRGFRLQESMSRRFDKQLKVWFALGVKRSFVNSNLERLPIMVLSVVNAAILGVGGYFTFEGYMTIGELLAFYAVFDTLGLAVISFMEVVPAMIEGEVSMRRINEVLELPDDLTEDERAIDSPGIANAIRFDNVTFGYSEANPVIRELSLSIPSGSYVAVVGASGSGKSTLLQLLMRFYDPQRGSVRIDDRDLRDVRLSSLLKQAGVIFQEPYLFHATIRDNLLVGHADASDEEVIAAARSVGIHDRIMELPDGYETWIENDGANLSVDMRNRLSIARTLVRANELTFLDEVAASLDPESEVRLNDMLARANQGRTVVAASHRLKTVSQADLIYFIHRGELVEQGSHAELMSKQGAYYELWNKQQGFHLSQDGEVSIDVDRLRQLPFFSYMDEDLLDEISGLLATEQVAGGQYVFRQGDAGNKMYIIARGKVEVSKSTGGGESARIAVLQDGDHFGEIALLRDAPRNADLKALTDCTLLSLTRKQLLPLLDRNEEMKARLNRSLTERS
ncbi:ABC transporter transmembrane domain-containing protein [Cohnella sp. GCM10027633]|uniref:ABC transporter transmembrane domain-containing protein n=1 Tax=unclassified Cohnella TaxID=2636738 RepID=UPI003638B765